MHSTQGHVGKWQSPRESSWWHWWRNPFEECYLCKANTNPTTRRFFDISESQEGPARNIWNCSTIRNTWKSRVKKFRGPPQARRHSIQGSLRSPGTPIPEETSLWGDQLLGACLAGWSPRTPMHRMGDAISNQVSATVNIQQLFRQGCRVKQDFGCLKVFLSHSQTWQYQQAIVAIKHWWVLLSTNFF